MTELIDVTGFHAIENVLQKRREQKASIAGKETPFRVEFRYPQGTKHWQYFETYKAALNATDRSCKYDFRGNAVIERPTSQQIQIKGVRGGWKKYKAAEKEQKP